MYNPKSKTPIAHYGGKQGMLSHIMPMVPEHDIYTEAFFGGGALFFAKRPVKAETINDILDIVVNFYEQVRLNFQQLKRLVNATVVSRTQHIRATRIINNRERFPKVQVAWAFWVTTNFSFSNKIGGGIKYSNEQNASVPEQMVNKKRRFTEWLVYRLENAYIENCDAMHVINRANKVNAFHYIDPPYYNADMGHYNTKSLGSKKRWTENNFIDLLDLCGEIKGRFLLSHYNSPILESYIEKNGWYKKEVSKRLQAPMILTKDKTEVLVSNYSPTCLIPTRLFD